jgi:endonuclease I
MNISKLFCGALALAATTITISAEIPTNYYSTCEGKGGQELLEALFNRITEHTDVTYSGLWTLYQTSDVHDNGKIWDIYSTKEWTYKSEQCGNYSHVGDCYNREHSMPKSWFNDASPMVSDAFHIYPTDGKVNGQRSNYPYGECANGTKVSSNGGVEALGKLGVSTFEGYSGTVFEPDNEYKGDLARSYFYMVTCYNDRVSNWNSDMLNGTSYPAFTDWSIDLLLKWHREDPVSKKETDRNEAIYAAQNNRNPFIDHPELVEYIWGVHKADAWSSTNNCVPELNRPTDGSTVSMGGTAVGIASKYTLNIKGSYLTSDITLSLTSDKSGFSLATSKVKAADAMSDDGANVDIIYTAATTGDATATLTLTSDNISSTVTVTATAYDGLHAAEATDITDESFVANWVYIGDADADGNYTLNVTLDGESIEGYPCKVNAADGQYRVSELQPETAYEYSVSSASTTSNVVKVTTASSQPEIVISFDGALSLTAITGEASDAIELSIDSDNIDSDITISIDAPFQLSTDKAEWANTLKLNPAEDRFYLRLYSEVDGAWESTITAKAGEYVYDELSVEGTSSSSTNFLEDFEPEGQETYTAYTYTGTAAVWNFSNAGIWQADGAYEGLQAVRFGKTSSSYIGMASDKRRGAGLVQFYAKRYNKDAEAGLELLYSTDQGESWQSAGTATVTGTSYEQYSFTVNVSGDIRVKVQQTSGARMMLDNLTIEDYLSTTAVGDVDYHSWDAYCRNGQVIVETSAPTEINVYGVDGVTYYSGTVNGSMTLSLAKGLYIIATQSASRRVLVK